MRIIRFDSKYRDDMIYMVLEAKNSLGRIPGLNEDLLNIKGSYFDKGDMFWLAIDEADRVVGCVGYRSIENTTEIWLHRLFVKSNMKHKGIGTRLLYTVEDYAKKNGKTAVYVHLGQPKNVWFESYKFYPKNGYHTYYGDTPYLMKKEL